MFKYFKNVNIDRHLNKSINKIKGEYLSISIISKQQGALYNQQLYLESLQKISDHRIAKFANSFLIKIGLVNYIDTVYLMTRMLK